MYKPEVAELIKIGAYEVGNYFKEFFLQKRANGLVPIMVDDFTTSFYFMPCDINGVPKRSSYEYLTFRNSKITDFNSGSPTIDMGNITKKEIVIDRPLIGRSFAFGYEPMEYFYFLWSGRVVENQDIPIGDLDIKKLMKLAQNAIEKREGLIIDEVLKNRLIKKL